MQAVTLSQAPHNQNLSPPLAFLSTISERDTAAQALLQHNQISVPTYHEQARTFDFDYFPPMAPVYDALPVMYALSSGLDGTTTASAPIPRVWKVPASISTQHFYVWSICVEEESTSQQYLFPITRAGLAPVAPLIAPRTHHRR